MSRLRPMDVAIGGCAKANLLRRSSASVPRRRPQDAGVDVALIPLARGLYRSLTGFGAMLCALSSS